MMPPVFPASTPPGLCQCAHEIRECTSQTRPEILPTKNLVELKKKPKPGSLTFGEPSKKKIEHLQANFLDLLVGWLEKIKRVVDLSLNQAAKPWKTPTFRSFLVPSVALFVSENVLRGQICNLAKEAGFTLMCFVNSNHFPM